MRYGIFGGTFDPPHIAHLILAAEAFHQLALEQVLWVLTPHPPHKQGQAITSIYFRQEMLRAALGDDPVFKLSMVDIQRSPPHYAVDTLRILLKEYPDAELFYIMGGDSLMDLPTWKKPIEFLQVCDGLGVLERPGREVDLDGLEAQLTGVRGKVHFIQAPLLEISSSEIRRRVRMGLPYRYYLPPNVYEIVQAQRLYMID